MKLTFENCFIYEDKGFKSFSGEKHFENADGSEVSFSHCFIFPTFSDVHVHLREPGFTYKETIKTGTMAGARGGYGDLCTMPNLNPVPDSYDNIMIQLSAIKNDAVIDVHPFGAISKDEKGMELSDMDSLSSVVVGFSDDGRGVQSELLMAEAMEKAKRLGKIIAAHCEDNLLLNGGYIHDGEYAKAHSHKGICSESEWGQIKRDIDLAEKIGCAYHVCHISTKESVELIRQAKKRGVNITCETAPHYLVLDDSMLKEEGSFKMNPPLRAKEDREALILGICDGTIDMIATDHAPHSREEKSKGLEGSLMGITGLETAFPILYTHLVKKKIISLEKLIELLWENPKKRFGIGKELTFSEKANFTVFDLESEYKINSEDFLSMGKSTPFENEKVFGKCKLTFCKGDAVWKENLTEK